jgi:flagellar hook protein FlgE
VTGFFLVNQAAQPSASDQYLFSRAGSFYTDNLGYLKNTGGYYLQGWPTDRQGNVVLPSGSTGLTNQNIISSQFLETINLNRLGGTADETTKISVGANLPANDPIYDPAANPPAGVHDVDVQFFDTLGNTNAVAFSFSKSGTGVWDLTVAPPKDTGAVTLYDSAGEVYKSIGQLEFTKAPAAGDTLTITGNGVTTTYTFGGGPGQVPPGASAEDAARNLAAAITTAAPPPAWLGDNAIRLKPGSNATLLFSGGSNAGGFDLAIDASLCSSTRQSLLQDPVITVAKQGTGTAPAISFTSDGLPRDFGVAKMGVQGFVSGAASMINAGAADATNATQITINLGLTGEADGITQLSGDFTPKFIEQDGARSGVYSGVTVSADGLVSALFDNGDRRPIYRLPLVTFVNPDGLEAKSGNVWSTTEVSGNPTLRVADSGAAGQIVQFSLEASTVDIGEEFTDMIVVQRAYSRRRLGLSARPTRCWRNSCASNAKRKFW